MKKQQRYIVSKTPLRVSFAGGGSDIPEYFENSAMPGHVVSSAIDKFVYVTVKSHGATFDERIRLNYSITETASEKSQLKNDIIRSCLEYLEIDDPIYISSVSDVPAGSGLGSSSAFTVGLLNCLHRFRGDPQMSPLELAAEAVDIELNYVGSPIGLQDQYGCALGGVKSIEFFRGRNVRLRLLDNALPSMRALFSDVLFFWTHTMRSANDVLLDQTRKTKSKIADISKMVLMAREFESVLESGITSEAAGKFLDEGWQLKKTLSDRISYSKIDEYYDLAMALGAYGGKLLGAGGGGFLLVVAPRQRHPEITSALSDFLPVDVRPTISGTQVLIDSF